MSDLGLDLVRTAGRASEPVEVEIVRELKDSDLIILQTAPKGVVAPSLKKIRDSHHALARIIAAGYKPAEASAITGYSPSRISILLGDPAFQELIEHYRERRDSAEGDFDDRANSLLLDAIEHLRELIHDEENPPGIGATIDAVKVLADRTGRAPVSRIQSTNLNVNLAGRIEAGRRRAGIGGSQPPTESSQGRLAAPQPASARLDSTPSEDE